MRTTYAEALYKDDRATLDDLREAVTTLEETARIARRAFGGAHPITKATEVHIRKARAALRPREIEVKISKHVRSYLPPARLVIYRQVNHEWLRAIDDELRE